MGEERTTMGTTSASRSSSLLLSGSSRRQGRAASAASLRRIPRSSSRTVSRRRPVVVYAGEDENKETLSNLDAILEGSGEGAKEEAPPPVANQEKIEEDGVFLRKEMSAARRKSSGRSISPLAEVQTRPWVETTTCTL